MSIEKFIDSTLRLSKEKEIAMFFIVVFTIAIMIDIFVYHNDVNIGNIALNSIRAIWYIGFFISSCAFGIKKLIECLEKRKYFKIMDNLDNEHLEVLKSFVDANSSIAEIKNNGDILMSLSQLGFEIDNIGELYWGNPITINDNVYTELMSKVKLINEDVLPYIKAYFKKKKHLNKTY